ncbi:DUF1127 domain-containing protein [Acidisoma silvae]|nr:DUF1127 domain-containing protein [Acidisoma silvae]
MENIDNATVFSPITQPRRRVGVIRAIWPVLRSMWKTARSRRELARMDAHLFADIGISRGEALMESERRPWDRHVTADPSRRSRGD